MVSRESLTAWVSLHIAELVVLPVAAICAVTSWAYVLWLAFMPEAGTSVVLGLLALVSTTVAGTVLVASLRLPSRCTPRAWPYWSPCRCPAWVKAPVSDSPSRADLARSTVPGVYRSRRNSLPRRFTEGRAKYLPSAWGTQHRMHITRQTEPVAAQSRLQARYAASRLGPDRWLVAGGFGLTIHKKSTVVRLGQWGALRISARADRALGPAPAQSRVGAGERSVYRCGMFPAWPRTVLLCALVVVVAAVLLPADVSPCTPSTGAR